MEQGFRKRYNDVLLVIADTKSAYLRNSDPGSILLVMRAKIKSVILLVGSTIIVGCSSPTSQVSTLPSDGAGESFEKRVFDLVADYYCARLVWPASWADVQEFERGRDRDPSWLAQAKDVTLASPRAILMSFNFTDQEGTPKKATYIAPPRCGKATEKGVVSIAADGVVFTLPDGFELMPGKDIKQRWRSGPYPDAAWSSEDGCLLAVRFGDVEIKPEELAQFSEDMAQAYESSVPSLIWTAKESRKISDKNMLYHEFQNTTSTGQMLNAVLSGVFDGRLFAITVSGPSDKGDAVLKAARSVERTLKIR